MIDKDSTAPENDASQSNPAQTNNPAAFNEPHNAHRDQDKSASDSHANNKNAARVSEPPEKFKRWRRLFQYVIPSITGFLTLIVLIFQLRIYHQQVEEMRLDRRAWIAVDQIRSSPEVGKPFRVSVVITNNGRTFARQCRIVGTSKPIIGSGVPDFAAEIQRGAKKASGDASQSLIAPNARHEIILDSSKISSEVVREDGLLKLKKGVIKIFVFGEITYSDIFNHAHWLTFCQVLSYDSARTENGGWEYFDYKKYNETGDGSPYWRF